MPTETTLLPRVFAVVPAAGRSRRMGTAKQLLDVAGRTMLAAVLEPLAAARIAGIALVTHSELADKIDVVHLPNVFVAINDDETSEMIDSIRIGLAAWSERENLHPHDGFLVCPADHPGITTPDFDACIAAFENGTDRIVIASRAERRGHPIIFPAGYAQYVVSEACDHGLNVLPREHPERVVLIECPSVGVSRDVDTPSDYDQLA